MPWEDFDGFAHAVEQAEPCVNLAALVGHSALRVAAVGTELRPATADETAHMCELLARAAEQGVFGLSTGLIYAPGSFAGMDEVVALTAEARRAGLLYSTHIRDEGDHLVEAVTEALDTARRSGVRLQVSHLKAMGPANHGKVHEALALIESAAAEGLDVACDVYPYAASSTRLTSRLPDWALDGGLGALLARLDDPKTREAIASELRAKTGHTFFPRAPYRCDATGPILLMGGRHGPGHRRRHWPRSGRGILRRTARPPGSGLDRQPCDGRSGCGNGAPPSPELSRQ